MKEVSWSETHPELAAKIQEAAKPKPGDINYINLSIPAANEAKERRKKILKDQ